jgi:hypothetical protein
VIPNYGRCFDDILIKEKVDDSFGNISDLHVYIANPIYSTKRIVYPLENDAATDIRTLFHNMSENYIINRTILYIKIPRLRLGEDIVYDYTVKSNKSGIFSVDTLFRLNDSKWPDSLKEDTIEVRPPEIDVGIMADQFYAICKKPLTITYSILHRSGWCNDPTDISLFFNQTDNVYKILFKEKNDKYYKEYDGRQIKLNLTPLEPTQYSIQIEYQNAGRHPIPRINVVNATVNQQNVEIDVIRDEETKTLQDYSQYIGLLSLIFAFFGLMYQEREIYKLKITINQINQNSLHVKMDNGASLNINDPTNAAGKNSEDSIKERDNGLDL